MRNGGKMKLLAKASFLVLLFSFIISSSCAFADSGLVDDKFGGRDIVLYVPSTLPAKGTRALIIVMHGATGNARHIEMFLGKGSGGMNEVAEKNGFIVAYLNGTLLGKNMYDDNLGWNAGRCCGMPSDDKVNDVGYIKGAAAYLKKKYGIDHKHVYGIGFSNGAMMAQRLMCETDLFAAIVPVAGPLETGATQCPSASGKHILALHGANDHTVPIAGGAGANSTLEHPSEAYTQNIFVGSGATYELVTVANADHKLPEIESSIENTEQQTLSQKAARFFGFAK